jgi:hypothetical protein
MPRYLASTQSKKPLSMTGSPKRQAGNQKQFLAWVATGVMQCLASSKPPANCRK